MSLALTPCKYISSSQIPGSGVTELYQVFTAELVNATATVDSVFSIFGSTQINGFSEGDFHNAGIWVQLTGATPNVIVQILQSFNDTLGNYVVPEVGGSILTLTDVNPHTKAVVPVTMKFLRFRLAGQAGNGANVTCNLVYARQT